MTFILTLTVILLLIAAVAKAAMDTLAFWHHTSLFHEWGENDTAFGRFWAAWAGPESWRNKYRYSENPILSFLMQGPLVAFTDAWHAFQWVFLTCVQLAIAIHLPGNTWVWIAGMKIGMGLVFEAAARIWRGEIEIEKWLRNTQIGQQARSGDSTRYALPTWAYVKPTRISMAIIATTFGLMVLAVHALGGPGDLQAAWTPATTAALVIGATGLGAFWAWATHSNILK